MKVNKLNSILFVLLLSAGYVLADASDNEIRQIFARTRLRGASDDDQVCLAGK